MTQEAVRKLEAKIDDLSSVSGTRDPGFYKLFSLSAPSSHSPPCVPPPNSINVNLKMKLALLSS